MTSKDATKHEFICKTRTLQRHFQLLKLAESDEKYSDSFSELELEEEPPKTPINVEENVNTDEQVIELEEAAEFEEKSSSETSLDNVDAEDAVEVAVEYMDDDESEEGDADFVDVLEGQVNFSSNENSAQSASSPKNTTVAVEYQQELPTEFVDDTDSRPPIAIQEETVETTRSP